MTPGRELIREKEKLVEDGLDIVCIAHRKFLVGGEERERRERGKKEEKGRKEVKEKRKKGE